MLLFIKITNNYFFTHLFCAHDCAILLKNQCVYNKCVKINMQYPYIHIPNYSYTLLGLYSM